MSRFNTIRDYFIDYKNSVIPNDAEEVQIIETRRAFFAGAFCFMRLLEDSPEDDVENEKFILGLKAEIKDFYDRIKAGKE